LQLLSPYSTIKPGCRQPEHRTSEQRSGSNRSLSAGSGLRGISWKHSGIFTPGSRSEGHGAGTGKVLMRFLGPQHSARCQLGSLLRHQFPAAPIRNSGTQDAWRSAKFSTAWEAGHSGTSCLSTFQRWLLSGSLNSGLTGHSMGRAWAGVATLQSQHSASKTRTADSSLRLSLHYGT
jgi:hypothetical protein